MSTRLEQIDDRAAWDAFVGQHPWGHPLQLWGWGETKREGGWTAHRLVLVDGKNWVGGAQVLCWMIPRTGHRIVYVPRGPVIDPTSPHRDELLLQLVSWARQQKALYLRIEPAWREAHLPNSWCLAAHHLQLPQTYTLDLTKSEEALLEPMARKTRQYIRKAERDGITVEESRDVEAMLDLYQQTATRAGFGIHPTAYYRQLMDELGTANHLFYASYESKPVAFLWLAAAGQTAYELYGGVDEQGQDLKANYFLKWAAITTMQRQKLAIYDFNGRLNEGVGQFKVSFGPDETDYIGTYDYVFNRTGYRLWEQFWPLAKPVGRRFLRMVKR